MNSKSDARLLEAYLSQEWEAFGGKGSYRSTGKPPIFLLREWLNRTHILWHYLDAKGLTPPAEFLRRYPIATEDLRTYKIQTKYMIRGYNLLREMARLSILDDSLFTSPEQKWVLDLSSGACGVAEVLSHYGHFVRSTDFMDDSGSSYRAIHQAQEIGIMNFDGRSTPYEFITRSFDHVCCFQAINFYGAKRKYPRFIKEMQRISRDGVFVIFNSLHPEKHEMHSFVKASYSDLFPSSEIGICPDTQNPFLKLRAG